MNQPSNFRTRNWVETIDELRGKYDSSSIKFKTSVIRSNLCDYSDTYIHVSGTMTVTGAWDNDNEKETDERNKVVIFTTFAPLTNWLSSINNIKIDNEEYIDLVMPMYSLIEYSDNYCKTSGSLWQYYRYDPNVI